MQALESTGHETIAQRLEALLADAARDARVEDVRIGLGYTAVVLDGGRAGVAYTFHDQAVVSEGGGMRQFSPHVQKVTFRLNTIASVRSVP